jgi:filamentous hemagglutinin family protein
MLLLIKFYWVLTKPTSKFVRILLVYITSSTKSFLKFLHSLLINLVSFTLIFNPIFISSHYAYAIPTQNNVPIVNIATPSNAGVSKNNFHDFNVGNEGAIMNNSNQIATSKLGGALYANPNLDPTKNEARIILNEVTSTNRSKLYGAN